MRTELEDLQILLTEQAHVKLSAYVKLHTLYIYISYACTYMKILGNVLFKIKILFVNIFYEMRKT